MINKFTPPQPRIVEAAVLLVAILFAIGQLQVVRAQQTPDQTQSNFNSNTEEPPVKPAQSSGVYKIYLPAVKNLEYFTLLGISSSGFVGKQSVIDRELHALDQWAGKKTSIVGIYLDIEDPTTDFSVPNQMEKLRVNGYTGFINLMTTHPIKHVASGEYDSNIRKIAHIYSKWSKGGPSRMAYIAPFPEMNGDWYIYGQDPANYKLAYKRIQNIFLEEGVAPNAVQWVFPPNGWSDMPFENFYPGDDLVDVFAFSSYNYGHCPAISPWEKWWSPEELFGPYIQRFQALDHTKPIFIAQTGSTAQTAHGYDSNAKNQWIRQTYDYLAHQPAVRAILYFNIQMECDWPIFTPSGIRYQGYADAAKNPGYIYIPPEQLATQNLSLSQSSQ